MKKYLLLLLLISILSACANSSTNDAKTNSLSYIGDVNTGINPVLMNENLPVKKLVIKSSNGSHEFQVEIASNDAQRKVGLMNRKSLDETRGMLFIFQSSGIVNFWMKNTLISLDMVFIDSNGYIKHIERNVQPCNSSNDKDCVLYGSRKSVQFVLELKGGAAERQGIKEGDRATWV